MRAVQFERFGEPGDVLQLRETTAPTCAAGQARVRMLYSPINPSDLLRVRGVYGPMSQPVLSPGFEGVGIVEEVRHPLASTLLGVKVGRRVVVLNQQSGNWQEQVVIPALRLFPLPSAIPDEQAAGFFVNPATAWIMVSQVLQVPRGAWLLQSAAGSAVGKMVIKLGKKLGFQTINVVRRSETAETLTRLGADVVLDSSRQNVVEEVERITNKQGVRYALDPVGGASAATIISALGEEGKILLYGSLDWNPTEILARHLIRYGISVEGFALQRWSGKKKPIQMLFLLRQIAKLMQEGVLTTDIARVYPLEEFQDAIRFAEMPGRQGKVLLKISN